VGVCGFAKCFKTIEILKGLVLKNLVVENPALDCGVFQNPRFFKSSSTIDSADIKLSGGGAARKSNFRSKKRQRMVLLAVRLEAN
jgi:hypothetical protein